jgi:hypothetical protein
MHKYRRSPKADDDLGRLDAGLQLLVVQALNGLSDEPDALTTWIPGKAGLLARRVMHPDARNLFPHTDVAEEPEDHAPSDYLIVYQVLSKPDQRRYKIRHLIIRILDENSFIRQYLQGVNN